MNLLSREHSILEREFMEYQPFGIDPAGQKIQDVSGVTVAANVGYLEEIVELAQGKEAAVGAVNTLCERLNRKIRDSAYHVTPGFLKNSWNSYSYEFVCFLGEFCQALSGDPDFQFNVGKNKFISPLITTLAQPFAISNIYKMFATFGEKFAKGSIHFEVGAVTSHSAVLRMKFTERIYAQFGPYRKACAYLICRSAKGGLSDVPHRVHHLPPATISDRSCIADGDEYCEWEIKWEALPLHRFLMPFIGLLIGGSLFGAFEFSYPTLPAVPALLLSFMPAVIFGLSYKIRELNMEGRKRELLLQEQNRFGDARYEELRDSYLERQQMTIALRRRVGQLTTLHQLGLILNSTLEREVVLMSALRGIIDNLQYHRVMLSFYDPVRQVSHGRRILGVSEEIARFTHSIELPVTDIDSVEGTVLLKGTPVLSPDIRNDWERLHPMYQQLALMTQSKSFISVPLKVKSRIIGSLTVDRTGDDCLTNDDLDLMVTVASQIATALDNADAYSKIEELNIGLEAKVHDRTLALEKLNQELEAANERLKDTDLLKTLFVSIVSHELKTPLTSILAYADNAIDGVAGDLSGKQFYYMTRIKHNVQRMLRMTRDLLDLSRIEAGQVELHTEAVSIPQLINDVIEGFLALATEKSIQIQADHENGELLITGDRDKLYQVLTNLIENAFKFTPEGGRISVTSTLRDDRFLQIRVADTGCGIPSNEVDRVFDRFYRGISVRSDSRGAGLGLALAKDLIHLHGGEISVASKVGEGTEFSFTLPTD